jgi:pyruvate,water dikinase
VRRIFLELGERLVDASVLPDARDIFYLEVDEVLGFVEGTATTVDLAGLAAARRQEFDIYRDQPAPPARFESRGPVYLESAWRDATVEVEPDGAEVRAGTGCCPGVVTGTVRVVTDPTDAVLEPGSILVAERTDPGWIMLFPMAAGLLVQHGNLLSHSAIVSREMGIPAIVAIGGVTSWLQDGDTVQLDGTTGIVRRLTAAGALS